VAIKKNIADLPILRHYDKILVVLVLIVLLVSLVFLILANMAHETNKASFAQDIETLKPSSKPVEPIGMAPYEHAAKLLAKPFVVSSLKQYEANFLTPEYRQTCASADCRKPIPEVETCPFCGEKQDQKPVLTGPTAGVIPDEIKTALGLDIRDASVEHQDLAGDGFTVIEKYHWAQNLKMDDKATAAFIKDPKTHPPYTTKLQVQEFRGKKLPLIFTAVNKMPDGNRLTFSWLGPVPRAQTYWVKEGQPIEKDGSEKTGYTAGQLEEKFEERDGPAGKVRVDVSTVTITRNADNKKIELRIGEKEINTDVEAVLVFLIDNSELTLLERQEFKLRDETYRVVSVNESGKVVVVEDTVTGQQTTVTDKLQAFKKEP